MNFRRGVTLDQLTDDLERTVGYQETRTETPDVASLPENKIFVVDGGLLMFRSGGKLYKLTATEVT